MGLSDPLGLELQKFEAACECWESNPGPLQEQLVLLTAELSLQPPAVFESEVHV